MITEERVNISEMAKRQNIVNTHTQHIHHKQSILNQSKGKLEYKNLENVCNFREKLKVRCEKLCKKKKRNGKEWKV